MLAADGRHGDELSLDELDAVALGQNADLAHPMIFGNGERAPGDPWIAGQKAGLPRCHHPIPSVQNGGHAVGKVVNATVDHNLRVPAYADSRAITASGMSKLAYTFCTSSLSSSASSNFNTVAARSSSSVTLVVGGHSPFALSGGPNRTSSASRTGKKLSAAQVTSCPSASLSTLSAPASIAASSMSSADPAVAGYRTTPSRENKKLTELVSPSAPPCLAKAERMPEAA